MNNDAIEKVVGLARLIKVSGGAKLILYPDLQFERVTLHPSSFSQTICNLSDFSDAIIRLNNLGYVVEYKPARWFSESRYEVTIPQERGNA